MNASDGTLSRAGRWTVLTLAVSLVGCNPGGFPEPRPMPLPPGVSSVASEFRQQAKDRGFVPGPYPHVRSRPAICRSGACTVDVEIVALGDSLPNPDNPPTSGFPYARIRNLDPTDREARYGFEPATVAEYYLWVDRVPRTTQLRWTILRVPVASGGVQATFSEEIAVCHWISGEGARPRPDVDFLEYKHPQGSPCLTAGSDVRATVTHASIFSSRSLSPFIARVTNTVRGRAAAAAPIWGQCPAGCCTGRTTL